MVASRLTLSNRQDNLRFLKDFIDRWSQERDMSATRRTNLERVAEGIFQHLVTYAYRPGQPGSIAISLEEKGPRLRLMFEDDASPPTLSGLSAPDSSNLADTQLYNSLQQNTESVIYYRTADRKNRLVVFLT